MDILEYLNWAEILVGVVILTVVGALWYSPILIGNYWMKVKGLTQKDLTNSGASMALSVVGGLFGMTIFNGLLNAFEIDFVFYGAFFGLIMSVFVVSSTFNEAIFDKPEGQNNRFKNWLIGFGFYAISYILAGGIMAIW